MEMLADGLLAVSLLLQTHTEGFIDYNSSIIRRVVDNHRADEPAAESLSRAAVLRDNLQFRRLDLFQNLLHALVLRTIGDGPDNHALFEAVAELGVRDVLHDLIEHGVVDLLVDVEALDSHAQLAGPQERDAGDPGAHDRRVRVLEHDGGVVAAELQRHALEARRAAGLHDLLPGLARAGEADLADAGIGGYHGSEVIFAADALEDSLGEEGEADLHHLEEGVRREGRRLEDQGVAGQQGRGNLATAQNAWAVPGDNPGGHSDGYVALDYVAASG